MITITINRNRIPTSIKIIIFFVLIGLIFVGLHLASFEWVSIGMKNADLVLGNQDSGNFTEPRINLGGLFANTALTLMLASLTAVSVLYALHSNKQSNEKQRIKYLEKGLEKFYIPLLNALEISSCSNDDKNQIFASCRQYSYLSGEEVNCLFFKYMDKRAEHPDKNFNNPTCNLFKDLLEKVKEDIKKNQSELRKLIEQYQKSAE